MTTMTEMDPAVTMGPSTPLTEQGNIIVTRPLQTESTPTGDNYSPGDSGGPSWGLIIPIIMIAIFLICVGVCLYWHKLRDKRRTHNPREPVSGTSFQRSYRSRSTRGSDSIRDSTRSTAPLRSSGRSSVNEKVNNNNNNNNNICVNNSKPVVKNTNVNVIPIQRSSGGKYSFYWDKNHWKAYPTNQLTSSGRSLSGRPLSPINEIDSPNSLEGKFTEFELSKNYTDISAQASFSPYHLTWLAASNPSIQPPPYEQSGNQSTVDYNCYPAIGGYISEECNGNHIDVNQMESYEPATVSPYFPNNNTPTTECDAESESSACQDMVYQSNQLPRSQFTSYPSTPLSNASMSRSNPAHFMMNSGTGGTTSVETSYPESSYNPSSHHSGYSPSSFGTSTHTSVTENPTNMSSLPSSIRQFCKQNVLLDDPNNNSAVMPNANCVPCSGPKSMDYTLASSLESSDTQYSDNTSMLPQYSSNSTSGFPNNQRRSCPLGTERSGMHSPEDLSKLVDEMSSIRPVDESSSIRPNSSVDPMSRVINSMSGHSFSAEFHKSWSGAADMERDLVNSRGTSSQTASQNEGSYSWDNYPLSAKAGVSRSYPDLTLHVYDNSAMFDQVARTHQMPFNAPILADKQYWV